MTTRLYYMDPYRAEFDATVVSCETHGDRIEVLLDQTAFYPTSGGQPFDVGTLGPANVLDVIDREDGFVTHVVDGPLDVGSKVSAVIDWGRRFDHMQQHTGQHVLSAAFDWLLGARTESFHLGSASSTIDLGREVTAADIRSAETEANRVVWENRPVTIRFATADEAAALPLRKDPARTGPLRLIAIEDFDLSACGGTHVTRTGAIGVIVIPSWEKFRGGTRVEFLCGGRVMHRFREWRDALAAVTRHLSVPPSELAAGVERLQADAKGLQRTMRGLQEQLALHEARALVARGDRVGDRVVIAEALDGWDASGLKTLATSATVAEPTAAVALFSRATPAIAVIARGAQNATDASGVLQALVSKFGGKGGGKADLAQGGGLNASADELVEEAKRLLNDPAIGAPR